MCQHRLGAGDHRGRRSSNSGKPRVLVPPLFTASRCPLSGWLLLVKLENKAGRGRGMRGGGAINRGSSQEGEEDGQLGLQGQGPKGGGRRGQRPPGALTFG